MKKIVGIFALAIFLIPMFAAVPVHAQTAQVELTAESKAALISEIQGKIQELLIELIAQLQAQIVGVQNQTQMILGNTQQIMVNQSVGSGQSFGMVIPSVAVPQVNVSVENALCVSASNEDVSSVYGVKIPLTISGGSWDHISGTYDGYEHLSASNGITGVLESQPRRTESFSSSNGRDFLSVLNVPGTYQISGTVYDKSNNPEGTFTGTSIVSNACRNTESDMLLPIQHADGTWNGTFQNGVWLNTSSKNPYNR